MMCWVPSHVGAPGNEAADSLQQSSLGLANIYCPQLTMTDVKISIKSRASQKWANEWAETPRRNKLRMITDTTRPLPHLHSTNRHWERSLVRLRLGHCRFSHGYLMTQSEPPECEYCSDPLTVIHVLVDCPHFQAERMSHFPLQDQRTLQYMLTKSNLTCDGPLYKFLNSINFLHKI